MDGAFQWNAAWQIGVTTSSLNSSLIQAGSTNQALPSAGQNSSAQEVVKDLVTNLTADEQYISPLQALNKTYMTSGKFDSHYVAKVPNDNPFDSLSLVLHTLLSPDVQQERLSF